jgi:membrane-bound lytic murein transglycosylase D
LIASRNGVTEHALLALNGIQDPHLIYPGQQMNLPGFGHDVKKVEAIRVNVSPAPQTLLLSDEADKQPEHAASSGPAEPESQVTLVSITPTPQPALDSELLPPAAVLPDDQRLNVRVTEAEELAIALDPAVDAMVSNGELKEALAADPSDYAVASNNSIEIQASETLGHYADWLGIQTREVRRLNKLTYGDPVIIGGRLRLDFSKVSSSEFELKRREYHAALQRDFFSSYRIKGVEKYQVKPNDNIGIIARKRYATPIWLLRQYNPALDFNSIQIAQKIIFPLLERIGKE